MADNFYADYPVSGGGVTSLNGETGALTLVAGSGIAITTPTATTIQIASTSSGDVTIGAFGSTPNANGLSINGSQVLNMQPADATHPGGVSTGTQSFGGAKNFALSIQTPFILNPSAVTILDTANATLNDWSGNPFVVGSNHTLSNGGTTLIDCSGGMAQFNRGFRWLSNDGSHAVDFTLADGGGTTYALIYPNAPGSANQYLITDGNNPGQLSWVTRTAGTVTSVAMTVPAFLSIAGSPITSSGTLALSLSGTALPVANGGTGVTSLANFTAAGTDGIVVTGGSAAVVAATSIAQHVADSTHNGYLTSTDWSTFNAKQAAGNYITALTGDATAAGPGSVALTLATVNGNVGSFGSSTSIPSFTVNAKGLITAASGNVVIAPAGTLTGTTLAANVVTSSLTTVGTIGTGTWQGTTITVGVGGTGLTTLTSHALLAGAGTSAVNPIGVGAEGQILQGVTGDYPGWVRTPKLGLQGTASGSINLEGVTSGNVTMKIQAAAGTYNFNLPTTAGTAGQVLTSQAGGSTAMTWSTVATAPVVPTQQKFTSGSGTYTKPAGVLYLRIQMVGGGGGGGGSQANGGTAPGAGGDGGDTTFGSNTAGKGSGANPAYTPGAGGTATLSSSTGINATGATGSGNGQTSTLAGAAFAGGAGGPSALGGSGGAGPSAGAGTAGVTNTGGGGGGAGCPSGLTVYSGCGGGAGGYIDAIIVSPSATYSYAVGAAGTAGAAGGSGGFAGGAGGSGIILVTEFYQ